MDQCLTNRGWLIAINERRGTMSDTEVPYDVMSLVDVVARAICDADEAGRDTAGTDAIAYIAADAILAVPVAERMRMMGMRRCEAAAVGVMGVIDYRAFNLPSPHYWVEP